MRAVAGATGGAGPVLRGWAEGKGGTSPERKINPFLFIKIDFYFFSCLKD
jgi:hypothetical protein